MKRITSLPLIIICAALIIIPFAYIVSAYTRTYSLLSGTLSYDPNISTRIYDVNGELISELFEENRTLAEHGAIPPIVKQAFLSAEDRNFYLHPGFDLPGIIRAITIDLVSGEIRQGGSTITQQLVKQLYTKSEKTLYRKIMELFLAREFEKKYSKERILEMYLNQIYFGHGVYGVISAARFFFEKDANALSAIEAALLAGIPSAPNRFSPLKNPRAAYEKSRQVLFNMIRAGYITKDDVAGQFEPFWAAYLENCKTKYPTLGVRSRNFDRAPYFTEYIRQALVDRFGENLVYRGGLRVYTTLDLRQQTAAEKSLLQGIAEQNRTAGAFNSERLLLIDRIMARKRVENAAVSRKDVEERIRFVQAFRDSSLDDVLMTSLIFGEASMGTVIENHLDVYERVKQSSLVEGALVALDPMTGGITAMVGGSDFNAANQLNRAVQSARQPGSAFKAFVYGAGIESKKITPATAFYDVPVLFKGTSTTWKPSNYEKSYKGKVLVRDALAASLNIVSVLVVDDIEPGLVARYASRLMGIPLRRFAIDPTISLGTSEVSPLEMARGFAVYANGGRSIVPSAVHHVLDRTGRRIYDSEKVSGTGTRVISAQTAFIMTSLLRSVVDSGTAAGAIRETAGFHLPAGGKTGTTSGYRDAWFAGFTPDLVAAVWMGCDSQKFSLGCGQSASVVSAPVWGNFMREVYTFRKPASFRARPDGISALSICTKTGKIPIHGCPARQEYFITGTEPREECNSDHDAMISIFDLVRKKKGDLLEKERAKVKDGAAETSGD